MSDNSPDQQDETESTDRAKPGRIGLGTVSIMVLFIGLIGAMCLGAALILALLFFRSA